MSHVITVLTSVLPVVLLFYMKAAASVYQERLHQCCQAGVETDRIKLMPAVSSHFPPAEIVLLLSLR